MPSIVMHVRRKDYVGFSSFGIPDVVLAATYYQRAAELARQKCGDGAEILIVSDDPSWCDRELKSLQPFSIGYCSQAIDFSLLSLFPIAVISNSTFSLAAACVGKGVESIIAPRYWFGHKVGEWYPPRIRAQDSRFTYV